MIKEREMCKNKKCDEQAAENCSDVSSIIVRPPKTSWIVALILRIFKRFLKSFSTLEMQVGNGNREFSDT